MLTWYETDGERQNEKGPTYSPLSIVPLMQD